MIDKSLAIIYNFGPGNADFAIRSNGKMEWNGPGERPTDDEIKQWDSDRLKNSELESQRLACIQLRRSVEYHFSPNARFKDPADVEKWRIFCDQLNVIIESNEIQEIPEKPFS